MVDARDGSWSVATRLRGPLEDNPATIAADNLAGWREEGVIEYLGEVEDVRPVLADSAVFAADVPRGRPRSMVEAMRR
jgi:hypothetical protein